MSECAVRWINCGPCANLAVCHRLCASLECALMAELTGTQITGVADLSRGRVRLRVSGEDRVEFLQGQCTNDVKRLAVGQSCYAAFPNAKGKMRGDAHIVCVVDAFLLEASAGLQAALEKFVITEDVVIEDVSAAWGASLVIGMSAPLEAVTFEHPLGTGVLRATPMNATISAEMFEVLRVEAGVPLWGVDMDENTIPVEAGLAKRAISYDKGCYIGQETIARIKTYGHVNRHLVQLGCEGGNLPTRGEKVIAGEREVGQVTSAVQSIRFGMPLALAYLRRDVAMTGSKVTINEQSAEVMKLCGE